MRILPYNQSLKEFSRHLRNNSTLSEVLLWQYLKNGQMHGHTFYRQKLIGKYIVDFYCPKLRLVIEVDGDSHYTDEAMVNDVVREELLSDMGLFFLRYDDLEVKKNIGNVLLSIESFVLNPVIVTR
jgi:very-short-patch-repair endonuclease